MGTSSEIRRGTTPTCRFNVDLDLTSAKEIKVTFKQLNVVIFRKNIADCVFDAENMVLRVRLSDAETLKLNDKYPVRVQIKTEFPDGSKPISNVMVGSVGELLE